jgi:hypothetical protein
VNVLDKNIRILHPHNPSALELIIFEVKVQFTATLGLALVVPIDRLTSLRGEGDGNNGAFRQGFRFEAINDVGNFGLHLLAVSIFWFHISKSVAL